MIAVDTNVLVYAHRRDVPQHPTALGCVRRLAESGRPWAIPWPCVHEFVGVVTNSRIFERPSTIDEAIAQVDVWRASPWFVFLGETSDHLVHLADAMRASGVTGSKVHDARIAALCLGHDVSELWSVDRDFRRFPGVRVVNPLVQS